MAPIRKSYDQVDPSGGLPDYNPNGMDQPEAFSGRPNTGGFMDPMTSASGGGVDQERQEMLSNMSRIEPASADIAYRDGVPATEYVPGRGYQHMRNGASDRQRKGKPRGQAQDGKSSFAQRYPDAMRIKLG
jgi:hypothetical protein